MIIREIKPSDNSSVEKLIIDVMTEYNCNGPGFSIADSEVKNMYNAYKDHNAIFFVIQDEKQIIQGCGGIAPLINAPKEFCELKKMYFYPMLRGKGFGSMLMQKLLNFAKLHYTEVYIETMDNMKEAQALYMKFGFNHLESKLGNTGHFSCNTYMSLKF